MVNKTLSVLGIPVRLIINVITCVITYFTEKKL